MRLSIKVVQILYPRPLQSAVGASKASVACITCQGTEENTGISFTKRESWVTNVTLALLFTTLALLFTTLALLFTIILHISYII